MNFITIRYSDTYNFNEIYNWCRKNCKNEFYTGTDWNNWISGQLNRIVQFVSKKDAILFILKFNTQND